MGSGPFNKTLLFLMLGLLTVSAFFIQLENFKQSDLRTIDEIVYYRMAKQVLDEGLSGYNTIPFGEELAAQGRPLPEYFRQPLFKHPPVFTFLSVVSMKIFGPKLISAEYISLLLSVLMIPLIYLLGAQVYDRRVGFLSALFLWMDPISIICSQKVWMDSTIAFFTFLSALFFIYGMKRNNDWYFILSGMASGFAVNTKYSGILITFIIFIFCLFYRKDLFKNNKFQLSLALPFLMLIPWLSWNYKVYGIASILKHSELRTIYMRFITYLPIIAIVVILTILFVFLVSRFKKDQLPNYQLSASNNNKNFIGYLCSLVPIALFTFFIPKQFIHSFQFDYLPTHGWRQGLFSGEPLSFYFGRLLEFSPIYILSFLAIFRLDTKENREIPLIRFCAIIILLLFIFWGNYQSRYVLSSLPFFIILGTQLGVNIYEGATVNRNTIMYYCGRVGMKLAFIFIIVKCYYLNVMMSYPNDMCYF